MKPTTELSFDVREIPFSTRGSWLNLSPVTRMHTRADAVHLVSHRNGMHAVLELRPTAGTTPVASRWVATPARFAWVADGPEVDGPDADGPDADGPDGGGPDGGGGDGVVEAVFERPDVLRLRGDGPGLQISAASGTLTPFTGSYLYTEPSDGALVFTSYETGRRYRITVLAGAAQVVGSEALGVADRAVLLGTDGGPWEAAIEEATTAAIAFVPDGSFETAVERAAQAFADFLDDVAPWRDERTPAAALAAYVLWSATVAAEGFATRESVLMSKHWMDKVWSWDHCFNALALAPGLPGLALDQFLAPFDHQDAVGALPDSFTHSEVLYNYVKPPIHGWAFRRLRAAAGRELHRAELEEVFDRLARWSDFWLVHRRAPEHVLPYYQHGNDSGWDNATTFDTDRVIEAPDLAAFLVLQLETLAELGEELGRPVERWKAERDRILDALVRQLWRGDGFVAVGALSGRPSATSSLLQLLPLVLAERLPDDVLAELARRVEHHLTDHGPATEPTASDQYEDDGYWRGPIWAPSTALLEDGLRRSGFTTLADSVSERFRALCERSGFAENFDARTGEGLRDRAYTWTASVYLLFAAEHVSRPG